MHKTLLRVALVAALVSPFSVLLPAIASADTVGPINFESYTPGIIDGQQGWTAYGSAGHGCAIYDEGVNTNSGAPASFGTQSFRISDAVTSGCFSDQAFSASTTNAAGESGADAGTFPQGTLQQHFESQFDIFAMSGSIGDVLSVSPDRGDGARMSYLRFENMADGIHVYFDDTTDVGPLGTVASFNETQIAVLDASVAHTVKFTLDLINGPANDVVKVYIDGTLRHIGTTWEDYYRFDPEQAGSGNKVPDVRTMLFRAGGTVHPTDSGKGYLIDNLSIETGASPAITSSVVVVTQNDLESNLANAATSKKWYFYNDTNDTLNNALGSFVTGPGTPPLGVGSAEVTLADATSRVFLANSAYGGTLLSTISKFGFSEYSHSGSGISATEVPFVRFNVDFTGSNTFQHSLVYEPNDNGTVTQNGWQSWDMISGGNAKWEFTNQIWPTTTTGPDAGVVGQSGNIARTWNQIIADYPSIQMLASGPQLGVRFGEPGPAGYTGDTDAFTIGINSAATTYDFDPAAAPSTVQVRIIKYIGNDHATAGNANNAVFPFTATYQASNLLGGNPGSDPFTIGPVGNGTPNAYEAMTVPLATGASYSASENVTGNDVVGATCSDGKPFAIAGYSSGDTFEQAFAAASSSLVAPHFTNLTSNKVVIVWNKSCAPVTPPQCNVSASSNIVSDTSTFDFTDSHNAVAVTPHPAWTTLAGSTWVYSDALDANGSSPTGTKVFTKTFTIVGTPLDSSLTIAADNMYTLSVNGHAINTGTSGTDLNNFSSVATWAIPAADLLSGANTITFTVTNPANDPVSGQPFGNPNPGGLLYKLTVNNNECVTPVTGTASISGSKFEDWDGDGSPFETKWEDGLAGWTISLAGPNGYASTTVTGKNGAYKFVNLAPGVYHVTEVQQPGWVSTYPSTIQAQDQWTVTLTAGQKVTKRDFGNFKLGSIAGMKYNDANGNHKKDASEVGLQGWTITLTGPHGFASSTVTDAAGNYSFTGLMAGKYKLAEVMQTGWKQTDHPGPVTIHSGSVKVKKNFGNKLKVTGDPKKDKDDGQNWEDDDDN